MEVVVLQLARRLGRPKELVSFGASLFDLTGRLAQEDLRPVVFLLNGCLQLFLPRQSACDAAIGFWSGMRKPQKWLFAVHRSKLACIIDLACWFWLV